MLISDVMVGTLGGAAMKKCTYWKDWGGGRETTIFSVLPGLMEGKVLCVRARAWGHTLKVQHNHFRDQIVSRVYISTI